MSVTLEEVMCAARCRAASLAAEVAGYVILGAADQVADAPRAVAAADVALAEDGSLRLLTGGAASDVTAESALRLLLTRLLAVSASVTPPLLRTSQRAASAGVAALVRELEAALIPVNRAAARRALSRLHRDVARAKQAGKLEPISEPPPPLEPTAAAPLPVATESSESVAEQLAPVIADEQSVPVLEVELDELLDDQPETPMEPIFSRRRPPPLPVPTATAPEVPDLVLPPSSVPSAAASAPPLPAYEATLELEGPLEPEPTLERTVDAPLVAPNVAAAALLPPKSEAIFELEGPLEPEPALERTMDAPPVEPAAIESEPPPLELEPAPEPTSFEPEPELEPTLELHGIDATDPMPEPMPELPAPQLPPRPEPARGIFDLALGELPVLERTPALSALVAVSGGPREGGAANTEPDPDEIVISRAIEQTVPLPPVATPMPRAVEPIAPLPIIALECLVAPPRRPGTLVPAPPRYAPRRSDVEALVASFEVSPAAEPRSLCDDLKQLAGVDRTHLPPTVTTRTPPPVVVDDAGEGSLETPARRMRIGLGALALTLALSTGGAVATALEFSPESEASAAAPSLPERTECAATVAVSGIPTGARASVREGEGRAARAPSSERGDEAFFTGLRCREPLEIMVASTGASGPTWIRVPISAAAMTPSPELPSEVRVALSVR
jgi:hypothetical protein